MGIIKNIADARSEIFDKAVDLAVLDPGARRNRSTANLPVYPVWFFAPRRGIPRQTNILELRQFSRSAWHQMVKNAIKKAVLGTEWDIVVDDPDKDENEFVEQIKFVKDFFDHPSRDSNHDFDYLVSTLLDDILDVDAGVLYFNGPLNEPLIEMMPYDGSSFLKEIDVSGFLQRYWQYSFRHPMNSPMEFSPDDIGYLQMNYRSHNPYGYSPLQSIQQVLQVLDQSTRYNKDFFLNNAIPQTVIRITGQKGNAKKVKEDWLEQLEGENARTIVINSPDMQIDQMALTNRDMEWLDGQKWYMHLVFAAHGLSPEEVGLTDSTHGKSVQEGQSKVAIKNAQIPYLRKLARFFTRAAIPRILGESHLPFGERTPLSFKYFPQDIDLDKIENEGQRLDVAANLKSINEVRKERGEEPFDAPQADDPFFMADALLEEGAPVGDSPREDDKKVDRKEDDKQAERGRDGGARQKTSITPPIASVSPPLAKTVQLLTLDASKHYDAFFDDLLKEWETQIVNVIDKRLYKVVGNGVQEKVFLKDFGDFLSVLLRGVSLTPFLNLITRVVKNTMDEGLEEAEKELDRNIETGVDFERKADSFAQQQFNGYTLPDGKKWVGLSGVARAVQAKVYDRVRRGFENQEMTDTIIDDIKDMMGGIKRSRAATIVRTESTRLVNEGKLQAYIDAGVGGKKEYVTFHDERTSEICKHLGGQQRELTEAFDGPDGEKFNAPPAHPNCRSFVRFIRN